jgi:hypothetical protein
METCGNREIGHSRESSRLDDQKFEAEIQAAYDRSKTWGWFMKMRWLIMNRRAIMDWRCCGRQTLRRKKLEDAITGRARKIVEHFETRCIAKTVYATGFRTWFRVTCQSMRTGSWPWPICLGWRRFWFRFSPRFGPHWTWVVNRFIPLSLLFILDFRHNIQLLKRGYTADLIGMPLKYGGHVRLCNAGETWME